MFKKFVLLIVIVGVLFLFGLGTAEAKVHNVDKVTRSTRHCTRVDHQRIGLGFDGIPFNGSHRVAIAERRAYRELSVKR